MFGFAAQARRLPAALALAALLAGRADAVGNASDPFSAAAGGHAPTPSNALATGTPPASTAHTARVEGPDPSGLTSRDMDAVRSDLDHRWSHWNPPPANYSVRDVFAFALDAAACRWQPHLVAQVMSLAHPLQDHDTNSATYGNFRWYANATRVADPNAVEFCMQKGTLIGLFYRDRLDPAAQVLLDGMLDLGVEGVQRHEVRVNDTAMFLMKTWNLVALGQLRGRPELITKGGAMLQAWLDYTAEHGITEYLSPTYYAVGLECLGLLARHAGPDNIRARAQQALDYVWTDIGANWYAPGGRLGGANSRCFRFVDGSGGLDGWVARAGWPPGTSPQPAAGVFDALAWVPPPPALLRRAGTPLPRFVFQRWGPEPGQWAAQYMTPRVSLGSAGACYDNMDKPLVAIFGGTNRLPSLYYMLDGRGDPYGMNGTVESSGQRKPLHLRPRISAVQRESEILQAYSLDLAAGDLGIDRASVTCVLSHVVFPVAAEFWIGAQRHEWTRGEALLNPGATAFVRHGGAVVAVRPVEMLTPDGRMAPAVAVPDGQRWGAARVTWIHAGGVPPTQGMARGALWVRAREIRDDEEFRRFRAEILEAPVFAGRQGDRWVLSAGQGAGVLGLVVDLKSGETFSTQGADPRTAGAILSVNGEDLGRAILSPPPPEDP